MLQIDYRDRSPIYEQIKEKMKELIIKGVLKPDERIPSVREMAQSLTINPNTIQKAYKDLEEKGYIYSARGKGSFVSPAGQWMNDKKLDELMQNFEKVVSEMILFGAEEEQIISSVNKLFRREEGGNIK
jgi:GntR family transcriptional regulator